MENPRHWRLRAQRYRLEASSCPVCRRLFFPPRLLCTHYIVRPAPLIDNGLPVPSTAVGITPRELSLGCRLTERITGCTA
jgi:hypothetical protein